jgi:LppM domain
VIALVLASVLVLSGCFTVDLDLTVRSDNTVDGTIVLAVDRAWAKKAGGVDTFVESLTQGGSGSLLAEEPSAGSVAAKPYKDADRVGAEYTLSGVPVTDFGQGPDEDLSIRRVADEFLVTGSLDLTRGQDVASNRAAKLMEKAEIRLAITFPGAVIETNGRADGRTVTWSTTSDKDTEVFARAAATTGWSAWTWWWLVSVGIVLIALIIGWQAQRRSRTGVGSRSATD